MRLINKALCLSISICLLFGSVVMAGRKAKRSPGINKREYHQKKRIQQGVKSGELTKEETRELRQEQIEIRKEEKDMKSDGVLTKEERRELHEDLNDASKNIYEEKHDDERRVKKLR